MPFPEALSVSPDGRMVAYSGRTGGATAILTRALDTEEATRLPGTEGAGRLFWSPDSRWIAFFANGRLKRVEADGGGSARNVAETTALNGGTWNAAGEILFGSGDGLARVLATGSPPARVTLSAGGRDLTDAREPYFLPDGRHFLFLAGSGEDAAIYAAALDSAEATRLVAAESSPVYAAPGYLLYHRSGTLYAQAFDASSLTLDSAAVRVADGLPYSEGGAAAFAASQSGVLIYKNAADRNVAQATGSGSDNGVGAPPPLAWASRGGQTEPASAPARWIGIDLSPDGKRIAAHRHDAEGGDIWLFDVGELTPTRFTFDGAQDNSSPVWSPDGLRIAFASRRNGKWALYTKVADNTSAEELVTETEFPAIPMSWSPDGERLVYSTIEPKTAGDIWSAPVEPEAATKPVPLLQTAADERNPQVSPDGRWLAYSSNETGRSEIYVRPFPSGPGRIQVSVDGGVYPRWRRDSRELYFLNLVSMGGMMAAELRVTGSSIARSVPRRLGQTYFVTQAHTGGAHHAFAVSPDGERFLLPQFGSLAEGFGNIGAMFAAVNQAIAADRNGRTAVGGGSDFPITVVLDWTAAARR
jgi:Tol biopolymer transport system component